MPENLRAASPGSPQAEAGHARRWSWPLSGGLVSVIFWGLAPVATRALVADLAPLPLLVLRLGMAALVLLPWALPVEPGSGGRRH
jgi:drug/metabolite transporter (DMT)-like permease